MSVQDFIHRLVEVYGDFVTEGMAKEVARIINKLAPRQREKLMETYLKLVPGNFRPDVKNIMFCMEQAGIRPCEIQKECPACSMRWASTAIECPRCGYDKNMDGDPLQYNKEWSTGTGRFTQVNINRLLENMQFIRRV